MSQFELFATGSERPSTIPNVDTVRARLEGVLRTLRSADEMPLTSKQLAFWTTVVPQMSNWLPEEERSSVCAEFESQVARLSRKAA
jgi:hypothetical protein